MATASRIALFGGTFDPVHHGHIAMAQVAMKACDLDQVRFLPCRVSPHKQDKPPTSAEHRVKMLKLATAPYDWAVVDEYELDHPAPSYSWMTAEAVQSKYLDCQLFWIMGSDQWEVLEDWDQPQRLSACVEFIVFHRGNPPTARDGYTLHALEPVHPANATEIREDLMTGKSQHPWLDQKVAAYANEQGVYAPTS